MNEMELTNQHDLPNQTVQQNVLTEVSDDSEYQRYCRDCNRRSTVNALCENFGMQPSVIPWSLYETPVQRITRAYHHFCDGKLRCDQLTPGALANLALELEGDANCRGFLNERIVHDECQMLFRYCRDCDDWTELLVLWCWWCMNRHAMSFWIGPALLLYLLASVMKLKKEFRDENWSDLIFDCINCPDYEWLLKRFKKILEYHWFLSEPTLPVRDGLRRPLTAFPGQRF